MRKLVRWPLSAAFPGQGLERERLADPRPLLAECAEGCAQAKNCNRTGGILMSETTEFTIGSEVACSDGACGELRRVVVNPVARALTHLVVEPRFRQGAGRLVPIDHVESAGHEKPLPVAPVGR